MPHGRVVQISVSPGGLPKNAIPRARVTSEGVDGDAHRDHQRHGGPSRAVCLYAMEAIEALQAEGHAIVPGSLGENLTVAGLDWASIAPGDRLRVGQTLRLEITQHAFPCADIAGGFLDGKFARVSHKQHPGWSRLYARVLVPGFVTTGDVVQVVLCCSSDSHPRPLLKETS